MKFQIFVYRGGGMLILIELDSKFYTKLNLTSYKSCFPPFDARRCVYFHLEENVKIYDHFSSLNIF